MARTAEGGVAGALGGGGSDGAEELVRDGGAVVGGAEGTGGEPGDAGAVLGGPGAGHAEHRPAAVDDLRSAFFSEPKGMGDSPPPG